MQKQKFSIICAVALLLIGISGSFSKALAFTFTDEERAKLNAGEIVYRPILSKSRRKGFYGGTGFAVVNAPFEALWNAMTDWSSYPSIYPNTHKVKEIARKGSRRLFKIKLGYGVVMVNCSLDVTLDKQKKKIEFSLADGFVNDLGKARGYWRFFPQKNGTTLVAYVVTASVPMGVVNLLPRSIEKKIEGGLLNIPGRLKNWIEGPEGTRYQNSHPMLR